MRKNKKNIGFLMKVSTLMLIILTLLIVNKSYENVSESIVGTPTNFNAISSKDGSIQLSWDEVENANGYEVWQSKDNENWKRVQIVTKKTTTTYTKLKTNIAYYYKVSAWTGTKSKRTNGAYTNVLSIFAKSGNSAVALEIAAPNSISLSGTLLNDNTVSLSYSITGDETVGVIIYQKDQNGSVVEIQNNTDLNNTNLIVSNLTKGNIYTFTGVSYKLDENSGIVGLSQSKSIDIQMGDNVSVAPKVEDVIVAPKVENVIVSTNDVYGGSFVADIYNGTNALRESLGLCSLTIDPLLVSLAQIRANDMATNQYFSHYKEDKMQLAVVGKQVGLSSSISSGENIARTTAIEDIGNRFVGMWTRSPGHYTNMIDNLWTKIGVAMAQDSSGRWYGVQIFSN